MAVIHGIVYLIFMLVFALGLFGWGNLLIRDVSYSLRVVSGMGLALFVGGIANLSGLAYGISLNLFLVAGVCLAVRELYLHGRLRTLASLLDVIRSPSIWLLSTAFAVAYLILADTVMIPSAYNYHDDLQKYFIHPVKMLATGSMYGSPLTALGTEFLGGQALLQAFFIHNLGMEGINAFDSTFCLLLACALLVEHGARNNRLILGLFSATLLFLVYPQYVNVSSLYSFVVFAVATLFVGYAVQSRVLDGKTPARLAVLLGVLYASAVVLKSTFIAFPALHFPLFLISLGIAGAPISVLSRVALTVMGSGLAAASVWLIEPARLMAEHFTAREFAGIAPDWPHHESVLRLFGVSRLYFGGTALQYTALVLLCVIGAAALSSNRRAIDSPGSGPEWPIATSASITLVSIFAFLTLVIANGAEPFFTSVRYSVPFILSIAPVVVLLALCRLRQSNKHFYAAYFGLACLVLSLQPYATFKSWQQARECGSALAFRKMACSERYRQYNDVVLGSFAANQVRTWQETVPPGEPIIAWINYGHHLDFARNPIFEVDPAGIGSPWAHLPDARYMIVDVGGYATVRRRMLAALAKNDYSYRRRIWTEVLRFMDYLSDAVRVEKVLYSDRQVRVLKISRKTHLLKSQSEPHEHGRVDEMKLFREPRRRQTNRSHRPRPLYPDVIYRRERADQHHVSRASRATAPLQGPRTPISGRDIWKRAPA